MLNREEKWVRQRVQWHIGAGIGREEREIGRVRCRLWQWQDRERGREAGGSGEGERDGEEEGMEVSEGVVVLRWWRSGSV